jgi:cobyrinic acid a,c-diamide synthase
MPATPSTIRIPRLLISAAWKSSGKTTVSLGLLRNFASRERVAASFKKGPDFIDPMWHRLSSGRECYNLDTWMNGPALTRSRFVEACAGAGGGIALIEGNHGLHDGLSIDGSDSTAGLAVLLDSPVLLVVDSRRVNRGVAAQVLGLQAMPPKARIAGVVLNHVGSARQEAKLRQAIDAFCEVPVLGAIPGAESLKLPERHLGLTTVDEAADAEAFIAGAADMVARHCDLSAIRALFDLAPGIALPEETAKPAAGPATVKIGVFRDAAFCFYYPDNLEALRNAGAELVFIDTFSSRELPGIDGLYIGGGFPESFFEQLSANATLNAEVKSRIDGGMPAWAECGGLIYLSRSATWQGRRWPLAGVLPFDICYDRRPVGCGYMELSSSIDSPWFAAGERIRAHEFHYSKPSGPVHLQACQFEVVRGAGVTGSGDGVLHRNLFASYAHLHAAGNPEWAGRFVSLAGKFRNSRQPEAV